jgi:hypothetical protein
MGPGDKAESVKDSAYGLRVGVSIATSEILKFIV